MAPSQFPQASLCLAKRSRTRTPPHVPQRAMPTSSWRAIASRRNHACSNEMPAGWCVEPIWVEEVIRYWFDAVGPAHWFAGGEAIDAQIRGRFLQLHERIAAHDERVPFDAPRTSGRSEDPADQALAVHLIERLGNEQWTLDAIKHKEVIDRFQRFPHRNAILNRQSSADEIALLLEPED
jgi:uncharacterized protein (DUF924 family)